MSATSAFGSRRSVQRALHRSLIALPLSILLVITLSACGPQNGTQRPDDDKLRKGIAQLIVNFKNLHPKLQNWNDALVDVQIRKRLPEGSAIEAGWQLIFPSAVEGELSQVVVPWFLLGQIPETFPPMQGHYTGGNHVPNPIIQDLRKSHMIMQKTDEYFAAIVNVRYSKTNPKWIVFESIPYLPVTDNAYGFATVKDGSWQVSDFGTANVGCGTVPTEVQSEFGFGCP
ncbi:MAG: hypothetical protein RL414_163 [Actinomycetota bacterium]|jgi:hypothetical protein